MGLTRKILNVFCGSKSSDVGIFGSKYSGSPLASTDPDAIQDISDPLNPIDPNASWVNGWAKAVVSSQAPCMEDMNGVMFVLSYMTKYLYQSGIAEWLGGEKYNLYAFVQYGGGLYMSIQVDANGDNVGHNPSSSPQWWRKLVFTTPWIASYDYNVGDVVSYNGRSYKCVSANTASSAFVSDFYDGDWDDGNPAGTLLHDIAWNKATLPYHYFDVTGADAGREISQTTYADLYAVIGNYYDNCVNYTTSTTYSNPSAGNFRLPDFRNTFFKNSGGRSWSAGHNAQHTHTHSRTSSLSLAHSHNYLSADNSSMSIVMSAAKTGGNWYWTKRFVNTDTRDGEFIWVVKGTGNCTSSTGTKTTYLTVPALSIYNSGSGSAPEPNYYGTRILLKY